MSSTITAYRALLQQYTPRPVRTEAAYRKTLRQVDELMRRPRLSRAESELIDVLATLVEQYESKDYPTPTSTPRQMLAHLIEAKEVSQAEVARATGIPRSTISAVLSGRRQISKANVVKLADYFNVPSALFLGPAESVRS